MQPALSQVSTLNAPFEDDVRDYAAGQCPAIELWLTKLESYLAGSSVPQLKDLLAEQQIVAPVASFQGGLLTSQGPARQEHWNLLRRRLELMTQLDIQTLVVACDIHAPLAQQDVDRAAASLVELATAAGQQGRRVALEFQSNAALGNNLQTCAALVADVGSPHLGICLDLFHYYTGPSKPEDLGLLTAANLFHVQVSDLADVPREFATDSQRILPGEGDIDFTPVLARLRQIDYAGYVSVELLNPHIWQVPSLQFGEIAMTSLRKLLGTASMGETGP